MTHSSRFILGLALLVSSAASSVAAPIDVAGIPNFHQVDERVYRGAQPDDAAWSALSKLGIKTVIDLRREGEHSLAAEAAAVQAAGMRYVSFPTNGFDTPQADQIARVLEVLNSGEPVFVHCKLGRDRTGAVIAAYRISHDGWENARALDEAVTLGLHWYEAGKKRFIRGYQVAASPLAKSAAAPVVAPAAEAAATQR